MSLYNLALILGFSLAPFCAVMALIVVGLFNLRPKE
jgi:hypothetical protein